MDEAIRKAVDKIEKMNQRGERTMKHTPGPWEYVPSTEHHGPYVTSQYGSDICDCYVMTYPAEASVRNGGRSKPNHFLGEMADPNARLMAASPELLEALQNVRKLISEAALTGFNCKDGDWADRLFFSQQKTSAAIDKALGTGPVPLEKVS